MIQIVLADDHLVIRHELKRLLAQEPEWKVSAEAGDGLEAVRLVVELQPHVLVTDLALPGLHGLEVTRRVHRQSARTRVIVSSLHADEPYIRQALHNGALAYVRKDEVGQHLLPAIRSALAGNIYLSPSLAEMAARLVPRQRSQPVRGTYGSLNPQERFVLQLMAQGYTDAEIAWLGLQTQAELTALAAKTGLRTPS
jgi:two-component system response regulator NreC